MSRLTSDAHDGIIHPVSYNVGSIRPRPRPLTSTALLRGPVPRLNLTKTQSKYHAGLPTLVQGGLCHRREVSLKQIHHSHSLDESIDELLLFCSFRE